MNLSHSFLTYILQIQTAFIGPCGGIVVWQGRASGCQGGASGCQEFDFNLNIKEKHLLINHTHCEKLAYNRPETYTSQHSFHMYIAFHSSFQFFIPFFFLVNLFLYGTGKPHLTGLPPTKP